MLRKVTLSSKDISAKQWASLILELNLIKKAWERYAKIDIHAPGIKKILTQGRRINDSKED